HARPVCASSRCPTATHAWPLALSSIQRYGDHRDLPSFPTRRSSDLHGPFCHPRLTDTVGAPEIERAVDGGGPFVAGRQPLKRLRSEEHTSELQSRENLVCRLLLEKKKIIHVSGKSYSGTRPRARVLD